jgi:hypothetical protein
MPAMSAETEQIFSDTEVYISDNRCLGAKIIDPGVQESVDESNVGTAALYQLVI